MHNMAGVHYHSWRPRIFSSSIQLTSATVQKIGKYSEMFWIVQLIGSNTTFFDRSRTELQFGASDIDIVEKIALLVDSHSVVDVSPE